MVVLLTSTQMCDDLLTSRAVQVHLQDLLEFPMACLRCMSTVKSAVNFTL